VQRSEVRRELDEETRSVDDIPFEERRILGYCHYNEMVQE
jgi:hypothetical protein